MASTAEGEEIALGPSALQNRLRPVAIWKVKIEQFGSRVVTNIWPSGPSVIGSATGPPIGRDQLSASFREPVTGLVALLRPSW